MSEIFPKYSQKKYKLHFYNKVNGTGAHELFRSSYGGRRIQIHNHNVRPFPKKAKIYPTKKRNANTTKNYISDYISRHGCPELIFSNNGKGFKVKNLIRY